MTQVTRHITYTIRHDLHNLIVVKNEYVIVDNLVGNMRYLLPGEVPPPTSRTARKGITHGNQVEPALLVVSAHAGDFVWRAGGAIAAAALRAASAPSSCA